MTDATPQLLLLVLALPAGVGGATINVSPTPGSLSSALLAASTGDELVLADGTYSPTADAATALIIGKDITLRAANPGFAVIDGQGLRRVIQVESTAATVTLDGLHITNGVTSGNGQHGGGVLVSSGSVVNLLGCRVFGNAAPAGDGGGLAAYDQARLVLADTLVDGNQCGGDGGGLVVGRAFADLTRSRVVGNTAYGGGGVAVTTSALFWDAAASSVPAATLVSSNVTRNEATDAGGGALVRGRASLRLLDGSRVDDNVAASTGGGVQLERTTVPNDEDSMGSPALSVDASTLHNNTAATGGALFAWNAHVRLASASLLANRASASAAFSPCTEVRSGAGGGMYAKQSAVNLTESTLDGNFALTSGGAVFSANTQGSIPGLALHDVEQGLVVARGVMTRNRAYGGAAVALDGGSAELRDTHFDANGDEDTRRGGAIQCAGNGASVILQGGSVSGNRAGYGAGMMVGGQDGTCTMRAVDVLCEGNTALSDPTHRHGGACAAVAPRSVMVLEASIVANNSAEVLGGGLLAGGVLNVTASTIESGAALRGAGVVVAGGDAYIIQTTLRNNTAGAYGGAAYVESGRLTIVGSQLLENAATTQGGGAIALNAPSSSSPSVALRVVTSTLARNTAVFGAVAAVAAQSSFDFIAAIQGCQVAHDGANGSVAAAGPPPSESSNTCVGNRARAWGDYYASLPSALVEGPLPSESGLSAPRRYGLGQPLPTSLHLVDAFGTASPASATVTFDHAPLEGSGGDASPMDTGNGCSELHCLLGQRLYTLRRRTTASNLTLSGLSLSGQVNGSRLLRAQAAGSSWSLNLSIPIQLIDCSPGYGEAPAPYAADTTVASAPVAARRVCELCPLGSYKSWVGTEACVPCTAGSYAASLGTTECSTCPIGTSTLGLEGASACTPCDEGTSTDGAAGAASCTLCAVGKYSAGVGAAICDSCVPGSIARAMGQASCEPCSQASVPIFSAAGQARFAVCTEGADCEAKGAHEVNSSWWFCREAGGGGGDCSELVQEETTGAIAARYGNTTWNQTAQAEAGGCGFKGAAVGWWSPPNASTDADFLNPLAGAKRCVLDSVEGGVGVFIQPPGGGDASCEAINAVEKSGPDASSSAGSTAESTAIAFFKCRPVRGMSIERCLGPADRAGFRSECAAGHTGPICGACERSWHRTYSLIGAVCTPCAAEVPAEKPGLLTRFHAPLSLVLGAAVAIVLVLLFILRGLKRDAAQQQRGSSSTSSSTSKYSSSTSSSTAPGEAVATAAAASAASAAADLGEAAAAAMAKEKEKRELKRQKSKLQRQASSLQKRAKKAKTFTTVTKALVAAREAIPSMVEPAKQAFGHMQLVTILPGTVSITWPPLVTSVSNSLVSLLAFDLDMPSIECIYPQTLADKIGVTLVGAAMLLATPQLTYAIVHRVDATCRGRPLANSGALATFYEYCMNAYIVVFLIVYAPVTALSFKYFICEWYGDGWYNKHDVTLQCYTAEGRMTSAFLSGVPIALSSILLVAIGLPFTHLALLWRHSLNGTLHSAEVRGRFGMLYKKYSEHAWWWDSVELCKKLCFTSVLAFVSDRTTYQCAVGVVVSFAVLVLHATVRPFKEGKDSLIALSTHVGIFSLNLVGLQAEANYTPPISVMLGLILLPLWLIVGLTILHIGFTKVKPKIEKSRPELVQKLEALPERAKSNITRLSLKLEDKVTRQAELLPSKVKLVSVKSGSGGGGGRTQNGNSQDDHALEADVDQIQIEDSSRRDNTDRTAAASSTSPSLPSPLEAASLTNTLTSQNARVQRNDDEEDDDAEDMEELDNDMGF